MLSSRNMIKEHDLRVFLALDLNSLGPITWWIFVGINVDHLPVSLVSE